MPLLGAEPAATMCLSYATKTISFPCLSSQIYSGGSVGGAALMNSGEADICLNWAGKILTLRCTARGDVITLQFPPDHP